MNAGRTIEPEWCTDVLNFWFAELGEAHWFTKSDVVDALIRQRFLGLHEQLAAGEPADAATPHRALATVVVLDQFPRNMFRGTPRAFATDASARRVARGAIDAGLDARLSPAERLFLYLPFEHSEDRQDQALAVRLIEPLGNEGWAHFARAHQSIIERFGRFPHRNAILGRKSSAEELVLLADPRGSF
jgi:uncharacterized protein (DUF924 family)